MVQYQELVRLLLSLSMPVIASVNGLAEGGGLAVACMCDLIIASADATFSVMQGTRGIIPDLGTSYLLPRKIGLSRALELAFMGEKIDAPRAYEIGLVNRVVPAAELQRETTEWATRLSRRPLVSLRWIKKTFYEAAEAGLHTALELEARLVG